MKLNTTSILFVSIFLVSIILIASSSTWLGVWMGLEINLLSFIPLLSTGESYMKSSSSMQYFLVQSMATIIFLIAIFSTAMVKSQILKTPQSLLMNISLLMKLGSSPFHMWLPSMMENMSWLNSFLIMTLQKLGPLIAINNLMNIKFAFYVVSLNLMVEIMGSLNQNSLRKLMAYSSINHTGWLLTAVMEGSNFWLTYFLNYTVLMLTLCFTFSLTNSAFLNQLTGNFMTLSSKLMASCCLLSMSGMPPFIGFLPKWLVLESVMSTGQYLVSLLLMSNSLVFLFVYMRISFNLILNYYSFMKMNMYKMSNPTNLVMIMWMHSFLTVILLILI